MNTQLFGSQEISTRSNTVHLYGEDTPNDGWIYLECQYIVEIVGTHGRRQASAGHCGDAHASLD